MSVKRTFLLLLFALLVAAALVVRFAVLKEPADFYRVRLPGGKPDTRHFRVNPRIGKIYFRQRNQDVDLKPIPTLDAQYFVLDRQKDIRIKSRLTGEVGFYIYIKCLTRLPGEPVGFSLELERNGNRRELFRSVAEKFSRALFQDLTLKRGDRLLLRFRGNGIVYLSRPILSRKKDWAQRKYIFLIGVDTLRGDHVGLVHNGIDLTPGMNRFIRDGVCFQNAFAQSSWTIPSFVSLFTGLYETGHNVDIKNPLDMNVTPLVRELTDRYVTFGIHGGSGLDGRWGHGRGFDSYLWLKTTGPFYPRGGKALFDEALRLMAQSSFPDLFLFLHTYQVHSPYTPPVEFLTRLNPQPRDLRLTAISHGNPAAKFSVADEPTTRSLKELYMAEVMAFDHYFGNFLDRLKELGIYRNSLIILMSDHGEEFYEHAGWEHSHSLYDELIRVPLVIKFPGNEFAGRKVRIPVGVVDIMPTLLSYLGIDFPENQIDGVDLMPVLRGEGGVIRKHLFSSISTSRYIPAIPPRIAIVSDHHKLIYNFAYARKDRLFFRESPPPDVPRYELYDLEADPLERINLAQKKPEVLNRLKPVVMRLRKNILDILRKRAADTRRVDPEVIEQMKTLGYW